METLVARWAPAPLLPSSYSSSASSGRMQCRFPVAASSSCSPFQFSSGRGNVHASALEMREKIPPAQTSDDDPHNLETEKDEAEVLKRQRLFNRIAPIYDNLNDWLSLGLHRVWKRMSVSWSGAKAGDTVLDICCGSGDLSFLLAQKVGSEGKVLGLDFAAEQLSIASSRQEDSPRSGFARIEWIQGDALDLPFQEGCFDAITMGYGLRNVANIPQALAEIHRVLKPGRKASILDFNRSPNPLTDNFQSWMLDNVVVPVATSLGVEEEYAYLKTSIARFPLGTEQEKLAENSGFSKAVHYELGGGLMGVLVVTKRRGFVIGKCCHHVNPRWDGTIRRLFQRNK